MTNAQQKAVDSIRNMIVRHHFLDLDRFRCPLESEEIEQSKYEFKNFDVTDTEWGSVYLVSRVGLKGDENTMASIFGRDYRHIQIGPRGGLKLLNAKHPSTARGNAVFYALTN
jgi:hypothetical protein|tara:strand:+ start:190 stop:528 length:339 start_codon:yes stop_codon:yes gene_type:complete